MANQMYYNRRGYNEIYLTGIQQIVVNYEPFFVESNPSVQIRVDGEPTFSNNNVIFNLKIRILSSELRTWLNRHSRSCGIGLYWRMTGKRCFGGYAHTGGGRHGSYRYERKRLNKFSKFRFVKSKGTKTKIYETQIALADINSENTVQITIPISYFCRSREVRYENFRINKWDHFTDHCRFYIQAQISDYATPWPIANTSEIEIKYDFDFNS